MTDTRLDRTDDVEVGRTSQRLTIHACPESPGPKTLLPLAHFVLRRNTEWIMENLLPGEANALVELAYDLYHDPLEPPPLPAQPMTPEAIRATWRAYLP